MPVQTYIVSSITDITPQEWDELAGTDNPFLEHAFLHALERSGSVSAETGWSPRFVVARDCGQLVGAVPLYLKFHSYGEYIFDWGWAEAASRAGIRYYPKLVAAIPFTPVTGRRLLVRGDANTADIRVALLEHVRALSMELRVSSVHFLFCDPTETSVLSESGYAPRLSLQFHWTNRSPQHYRDFDEYLSTFKSRHRKQVRNERLTVLAHGLTFRTATGRDLEGFEWEALSHFYSANVARHQGIEYLNPEFFEIARHTLAHRLVATLAYRNGVPVAGTVNFEKGAHLYGRYWGCLEEYQSLHFELCYYQLIERAIARGYTRFEAGAQGEHKLKRGLLPSYTHSAHYITHPRLFAAVREFLNGEAEAVRERVAAYDEQSPFRRDNLEEPGLPSEAPR